MTSGDSSLAHVLGRVQVVEARVRATVEALRARDSRPDDRFRGLYISDDDVDLLLAGGRPLSTRSGAAEAVLVRVEADADAAEKRGADVRLRRLARSFDLLPCDVDLLLVALAPELDQRFERLFAYLHDDVSRGRPSTGLALALSPSVDSPALGRCRLSPGGPLVAGGLVLVEESDRPFLTRSLRIPDRVVAHVLGEDTPDELVLSAATTPAVIDLFEVEELAASLRLGHRLFYVRERPGSAGYALAARALAGAGIPEVALDLRRLGREQDFADLARVAVREARLRDGGIVAGPVDAVVEHHPRGLRICSEAACPVFLVGSQPWDPSWSRETPLVVDAPTPNAGERGLLWQRALDGSQPVGVDAAAATAQFRLSPEQLLRAAEAAGRRAAAGDRQVTVADVQAAARAQNAVGLERLARRILPRAGWADLVLPDDVVTQLRELGARLRHRERVLDDWGIGRASSRGRGITCLFAGDSGTGKTMSAEVVAADLQLDLYVIDLSTVVDKYVGETEKNLDRVFDEADRVNGILLFDEADALFGKRSQVKDARDRWANVEVAYLLQRMELFDGIAILTTNLRANVDDAFTRRLDAVVDFPLPGEEHRRALWATYLGSGVPLDEAIDLDFLARSFQLTGGNIRNVVVSAAFLAAEEGGTVGMAQVVRAIQREYHKLGRMCVEGEFGDYYPLLATASGLPVHA